ncbi:MULTISPECIES: nucleobase:cation symporter-2 family protein [Brevibacillus]|jgi:xanthine permease|uniref:Xanthine permease n=1 Tax=Brevibacillus borstelensis AK1 TaxID=1300222 RepID=M8DEX2_9BACL|nr:nucleobase:cation symporter-2 family protein [Brevibacillus borstelensis]EMT51967.1 xanthine permease [Brevibacillus borstelensis AK1]KKX56436.1 xanthine permease [Brevibacillus borstelensis cifa_chp40]MCC0564710.1 purine permease [Brevibacillus borstelensis]MCM3468855.1 purine permease [Brevibacillus borstelensis]MCM3556947.1 purine permease [Brevibacillus borstelensis]
MLSKQKTLTLGMQHVLAMYAGAVIVPLIIGDALNLTPTQIAYLIAADLFTSGIATLLQVIGTRYTGIKLPVVLGCTFTAVGPIIAIASSSNLATAYGAIILSGLFVVLAAPLFGKLLRFFPTVVQGSVVTIIGLSLIPVAMNNVAGGAGNPDFGHPRNLLLALGTLVVILLVNRLFSGFIRAISVLIGLAAGTLAAYFMGMVSFESVASASWVSVVQPFYFGVPEFNIVAIVTMILVNIISMAESTGVYFALGKVTDKEVTKQDVVKGLRGEGVAIALGGIFNAFPYTAFSQNVGLVSLTGIKSRDVMIGAGGILVVLGLLPKLAALTTIIPDPVLGGAMIAMFGMVVASGINILSRVDLRQNENLLIAACSIAVGLGSAAVPTMFDQLPNMLKMLMQNGIVTGSLTAVILNIVLIHTKKENRQPVSAASTVPEV